MNYNLTGFPSSPSSPMAPFWPCKRTGNSSLHFTSSTRYQLELQEHQRLHGCLLHPYRSKPGCNNRTSAQQVTPMLPCLLCHLAAQHFHHSQGHLVFPIGTQTVCRRSLQVGWLIYQSFSPPVVKWEVMSTTDNQTDRIVYKKKGWTD